MVKGGYPDEKATHTVFNDLHPKAAVPEGQIAMVSSK